MAEKAKHKGSQTVREKAAEGSKPKKVRVLRKTATTAVKPLRGANKRVHTAFRPLSPLAKPFKSRPVRFTAKWTSKILLIEYLHNSWKELRQVTWPNRKQTTQLTIAVFAFALVFSVLITIVDYGLDKIFKNLLLK